MQPPVQGCTKAVSGSESNRIQRAAAPASVSPSTELVGYSSRSCSITFCCTVSIFSSRTEKAPASTQRCVPRARRSAVTACCAAEATYRQCFRVRAVLDERYAVRQLLPIKMGILRLMSDIGRFSKTRCFVPAMLRFHEECR
jgi:hypothetical protein